MKEIITLVITSIVALLGAAIPLSCAYFTWAWAMAQVPVGLAYTGLIKLAISLLLFLVGGGFTIGMTVMAVALGGSIALAVCSWIFDL
jgi:hypothetical protein